MKVSGCCGPKPLLGPALPTGPGRPAEVATAAVDVGLLGGGRARDEAVAKLSALVAPVAPRALVDGLRSSPTAGAFAVAWVLAKFTEIPRLAVTLALTPRVAAMRSVVRLAVRGVVS